MMQTILNRNHELLNRVLLLWLSVEQSLLGDIKSYEKLLSEGMMDVERAGREIERCKALHDEIKPYLAISKKLCSLEINNKDASPEDVFLFLEGIEFAEKEYPWEHHVCKLPKWKGETEWTN